MAPPAPVRQSGAHGTTGRLRLNRQPASARAGAHPGGRGLRPLQGRRRREATAGLYQTSGDWLYDVGLPGKSGVGGGIVTVAPGKGGLGTFAPPLDAAGTSVKGQRVARSLSDALGLNLFASRPAPIASGG
jgi:hypothetical protein